MSAGIVVRGKGWEVRDEGKGAVLPVISFSIPPNHELLLRRTETDGEMLVSTYGVFY